MYEGNQCAHICSPTCAVYNVGTWDRRTGKCRSLYTWINNAIAPSCGTLGVPQPVNFKIKKHLLPDIITLYRCSLYFLPYVFLPLGRIFAECKCFLPETKDNI